MMFVNRAKNQYSGCRDRGGIRLRYSSRIEARARVLSYPINLSLPSSTLHVTLPFSSTTAAIMTAASYRPHIDLAAILATQNPQIDLRLDEYQRSSRSLMNLVANYTKKSAVFAVEKFNGYNAEKSRLAEKIQTAKVEINQWKKAEIELMEGRH